MRIISKFRDYYDSMQKYADYDMMPFIRNIKSDLIKFEFHNRSNSIAVGFCGVIYNGYIKGQWAENKPNTYFSLESADIDKIFHSTYRGYFTQKKDDSIFLKYNAPCFVLIPHYCGDNIIYAHSMDKSSYVPVMGDYNKNTLGWYNFDEVIPMEQAYTELQSYIHFLSQEYKTEPIMSDKDRASIHGFDKNSFVRGK